MEPRTQSDHRVTNQWRVRAAIILLISFAILTTIDFRLLTLLFDPTHSIEHTIWYRALRVLGFLGTWLLAAIIFLLIDRSWRRAGNLILAPLAAAGIAELLKLLIGRARPVENGQLLEAGYHFRPFLGGFRDGHNLGMPSSHAAVAFAGAFSLLYIAPRSRLIVIPLALGCGYTRIASGAHFPTDVLVGATVGWIMARAFRELAHRIHAPSAVPSADHEPA